MRLNLPVSQQEFDYPAENMLVSMTDAKGFITHCNHAFVAVSGFSYEELIGQNHNLVRHPDMPRCVFKLLWEHIQNGQEIFAFVKNICKDGGYYWVWANVTPSMDAQGNVLGYYSVRRKPNPKAIPHVAALYRQLLQIEQTAGSRDAIEASRAHLLQLLNQQGVSYERFILDLQSL